MCSITTHPFGCIDWSSCTSTMLKKNMIYIIFVWFNQSSSLPQNKYSIFCLELWCLDTPGIQPFKRIGLSAKTDEDLPLRSVLLIGR
jgi:hypothetical protein